MRSSTSSSDGRAYRRAAIALMIALALFAAGTEALVRFGFSRVSRIQREAAKEYKAAVTTGPFANGAPTVLVAGNSLLYCSVEFDTLRRLLASRWDVSPLIVLNTGYLDWAYGLRRLFKEGARPSVVALMLSPEQLATTGVRGEFSAHYLTSPDDVLSLSNELGLNRTETSSFIFANLSEFYGARADLRRYLFSQLMPSFADLGTYISPPKRRPPDPDVILRIAELRSLCASYGIRLVMVVPPVLPSPVIVRQIRAIEEAAAKAGGVKVVVPARPGELANALFQADRFHMNPDGASVFTPKLAAALAGVEVPVRTVSGARVTEDRRRPRQAD